MNISAKDLSSLRASGHRQDEGNLFSALGNPDQIKPFVSFKLLSAKDAGATAVSGQAVIVYVLAGEAAYSDSTGKRATLKPGGWCWIIAGSGLRYAIDQLTPDYQAVQVCIALSPALETSPPQSACQEPASQTQDCTQVLVGWHDKNRSNFAIPSQLNYLVVHLKAGQTWSYELPLNHRFGWLAPVSGELESDAGKLLPGKLAVVNRPTTKIELQAGADSILVVGSAMEFGYDLLFHQNSVHTSIEALTLGLKGIANATLGNESNA